MLKLVEEEAVCISGNEDLIAKYFDVNFVLLIFTFRIKLIFDDGYIFFGERES